MMDNLSIFDFVNVEEDELFIQLNTLQVNDCTRIKQYEIRRTDKFYEIESDIEHLPFRTVEECCRYLLKVFSKSSGK